MTAHQDTGLRCLVFHGDGGGQCIECTCGVTVRPREWQAHIDAAEKEDARLKRLARLHEAEKAVIEAAKARVRAEQEYESLRKKGRFARSSARMLSIQHIVRCDEKISDAVANLRKLEGET